MTQENIPPIFCSACGQKNEGGANFCAKCGKQIISTVTAQPPPPVSTPPTAPSPERTEQKSSGIVTALAVVGFVFGLIGMLGSFIPIIGIFTIKICIFAALISAVSIAVAFSQNAPRTFPIAALTISLIGIAMWMIQINKIESATKEVSNFTAEMQADQTRRTQQAARQREEKTAPPIQETDMADINKYVGEWKYIEYNDPVGGQRFIRVKKTNDNKYIFEWGFKNQGDRDVTYNTFNKDVNNIYLKPLGNSLGTSFKSNNFQATHGSEVVYYVTLQLKSDDKLLYIVKGISDNYETFEATRI